MNNNNNVELEQEQGLQHDLEHDLDLDHSYELHEQNTLDMEHEDHPYLNKNLYLSSPIIQSQYDTSLHTHSTTPNPLNNTQELAYTLGQEKYDRPDFASLEVEEMESSTSRSQESETLEDKLLETLSELATSEKNNTLNKQENSLPKLPFKNVKNSVIDSRKSSYWMGEVLVF